MIQSNLIIIEKKKKNTRCKVRAHCLKFQIILKNLAIQISKISNINILLISVYNQ